MSVTGEELTVIGEANASPVNMLKHALNVVQIVGRAVTVDKVRTANRERRPSVRNGT